MIDDNAFHQPGEGAADVALIQRIGVVSGILQIVCDTTGMGFSAVGRVTDTSWTACAVLDRMSFGLHPGGQVDVETTFCRTVSTARVPLAIDDVAASSEYRDHPTPKMYGFRSYLAVPIVLSNGEVFGILCAFDPQAKRLGGTQILPTVEMFAQLIAAQIEVEQRLEASRTALVDAEAVGRLREHFVAILGHDLRNPLAAVFSGLGLLERTPWTRKPR
ncbi:MAG: GAF domain-containing protein [Janthinobacterium lividum]